MYAINSHQANKQSSLKIKVKNMLKRFRFSCAPFLLKPPYRHVCAFRKFADSELILSNLQENSL